MAMGCLLAPERTDLALLQHFILKKGTYDSGALILLRNYNIGLVLKSLVLILNCKPSNSKFSSHLGKTDTYRRKRRTGKELVNYV